MCKFVQVSFGCLINTCTKEVTFSSSYLRSSGRSRVGFALDQCRAERGWHLICLMHLLNIPTMFSSVQDGIYVPGKAHIIHSIPSVRSFPSVAFETVPVFVWLMMAPSRPFKEDRLALPLSYCVHNATHADCWAQNGSVHSHVFRTFNCQFSTGRSRNWMKNGCVYFVFHSH